MTASTAAIHQGENEANTAAIIVEGPTIRLFINGQPITKDNAGHPLAPLIDTQLTHGSIGLFAMCQTYNTALVTYTNALVWTIST